MKIFKEGVYKALCCGALFWINPVYAGFFDSADEGVSGRKYLESVQQTVEDTVKKVSPSIVYFQMALKKPGRTNSITLNGVIIDEKGHVATLYFKEDDVTDIKAWIGEQEYTAKNN